jgi:hypothetical protein
MTKEEALQDMRDLLADWPSHAARFERLLSTGNEKVWEDAVMFITDLHERNENFLELLEFADAYGNDDMRLGPDRLTDIDAPSRPPSPPGAL